MNWFWHLFYFVHPSWSIFILSLENSFACSCFSRWIVAGISAFALGEGCSSCCYEKVWFVAMCVFLLIRLCSPFSFKLWYQFLKELNTKYLTLFFLLIDIQRTKFLNTWLLYLLKVYKLKLSYFSKNSN
jgi:hypothetical protein